MPKDVSAVNISAERYHHGDLRNALLIAALELAAERGARALSLREVSRRAAVSHTAAYRHFASKEALLAEVATEGMLELHASTSAAVARAADPLAQLEEAGVAYVAFGAANPERLHIMFGDLVPDLAPYPRLRDAGEAAFAVLVSVVEAGQRAGVMAGADPRAVALAAWAQMHGLALLLAGGKLPGAGRPPSPAPLARQCARLLRDGLAVPQGRR